jgi:Family of unknown function (DUF6150)
MAMIAFVKTAYEADVKAVKVAGAEEADILVFVHKSGAKAIGDAQWFYVGNVFVCTAKIFWAAPDDPAALKVFFVDDPSQARWVRDHPLRGQL